MPGSKSIGNRALVIAALAAGVTELRNLPDGDDTVAMIEGLRALGVEVVSDGGIARVVGGAGLPNPPPGTRVNARLAGTTSRFLTAMASLADSPLVIDGDPPLRGRPMSVLHTALAALGARIAYGDADGHLPVEVCGPLTGGSVSLPGDVSSQFISALMLIAPVLPGGLHLELTTSLVSRPYVALTADVMSAFGVGPISIEDRAVIVPEGEYSARAYDIEPDASSASYPLAIAAVAARSVTVADFRPPMTQGDGEIVNLLERMGCDVISDSTGTSVSRDPSAPLRGVDVDMRDVSDLVPTIAAVATFASTPTTIRGVGFIRAKESDRIGDLADELAKTGASIVDTADGLHIQPVPIEARHGARLATHHDHRLAMAFAVVASAVDGIEIDDRNVVTKSWPGFWSMYDELVRPP